MRFRGLTESGEWIGDLIRQNDRYYIYPEGALPDLSIDKWIKEIISESLSMSTGLKDKNGTEIFGSIPIDGTVSKGGDEVKCNSGWWPGKVIWHSEGSVGWIVEPFDEEKHIGCYGLNSNYEFEVIGIQYDKEKK